MKLSDCIRLGATDMKQSKYEMFKFRNGEIVGACALGMACIGLLGRTAIKDRIDQVKYESYGAITLSGPITDLAKAFPSVLHRSEDLPDADGKPSRRRLSDQITYMNDKLNWNPFQIADWIEARGM